MTSKGQVILASDVIATARSLLDTSYSKFDCIRLIVMI